MIPQTDISSFDTKKVNEKVVDFKCRKCGSLFSNPDKVTDIKKYDEIRRITEYFKNICPEGIFHDFSEDLKICKKCSSYTF
jgi:ribosomal protein L40E